MPIIHTDVLSIDFPTSFTSVEQIGQGAPDDDAYDDALSHLGFAQYYAWQLRQLGAFNLLPDSKVTKEQLAWMIEKDMLPSNFPLDVPLSEYQGDFPSQRLWLQPA
ncbi:hypothetical protein [Pectobacterium odoriferum]|uniref:hypothetical protein n=1 Tax=Pectobacterium odoriferum TaxID=78398 RepID=UPI00215632CD|nr:hypothetical protein [Pectobacterium odoriferum]